MGLRVKIRPHTMYAKVFRKAAHVRRLTIQTTDTSGWRVVDEQDTVVVKCMLYQDWHRVERAMAMFAAEATQLAEAGWVES